MKVTLEEGIHIGGYPMGAAFHLSVFTSNAKEFEKFLIGAEGEEIEIKVVQKETAQNEL